MIVKNKVINVNVPAKSFEKMKIKKLLGFVMDSFLLVISASAPVALALSWVLELPLSDRIFTTWGAVIFVFLWVLVFAIVRKVEKNKHVGLLANLASSSIDDVDIKVEYEKLPLYKRVYALLVSIYVTGALRDDKLKRRYLANYSDFGLSSSSRLIVKLAFTFLYLGGFLVTFTFIFVEFYLSSWFSITFSLPGWLYIVGFGVLFMMTLPFVLVRFFGYVPAIVASNDEKDTLSNTC